LALPSLSALRRLEELALSCVAGQLLDDGTLWLEACVKMTKLRTIRLLGYLHWSTYRASDALRYCCLQAIEIQGSCDPYTIANICAQFSETLTSITLNTRFNDTILGMVAHLPNLQKLQVNGVLDDLSPWGWSFFGKLRNVTHLDIILTRRFTRHEAAFLACMPKLQRLHVNLICAHFVQSIQSDSEDVAEGVTVFRQAGFNFYEPVVKDVQNEWFSLGFYRKIQHF
jgi:hypothetical protein